MHGIKVDPHKSGDIMSSDTKSNGQGGCGCSCTCKEPVDASRRDFLNLTAVSMGAVAAGTAAWPLINSMNPAADTLAMASIEVDVADLQPGSSKTVTWRGKPVFIRRRTAEEVAAADEVDVTSLRDPQADKDRVDGAHKDYLIVVGVCTHLGCVPNGQKVTDVKGDFDGWFCPCHGSHYDTSGRIRKGPAPKNLEVPPYKFVSDTKVQIG